MSASTSEGRSYFGSKRTLRSQSSPTASKAARRKSRTVAATPVATT